MTASLLAGVAWVALAPNVALAQAAGGLPPGELEQIIVTANRRAEAIQSVPVAITAMDAESLRERNITTAADLAGQIPSVQVTSNASQRSTEVIVIRGQGQTYLSPIGVVQYFAEVPLIQGGITAVQGGPGTFFDVESVQVLRGPQGTLFGRNTTGGAVLLGPKKPTDRLEGYVQGQIGNYNNREYEGALNVPIIADKLLVRAAFKKVDRDGFTKDVGPKPYGYDDICVANPFGCFGPRSPGYAGKDYDDRHWWHGRIGITVRPTDTIENYLLVYKAKSHDNGTGFVSDGFSPDPMTVANIAANLAYQRPFDPAAIFDPTIAARIAAAQKLLGPRETAMDIDQFTRLKSWGVINTFSADLSDELTFRNITSYQRLKQNFAWDLDGSILPIQAQLPPVVPEGSPWAPGGTPANIADLSQITEEAQLLGSFLDDQLNIVAGGFYSKTKPEGVQGTGSFNGGSYNSGTFYAVRTRSIAGYAQGTLDLGAATPSLSGLKVTGGLRVTQDRVVGSRYASNLLVLPTARNIKLKQTEPTWTLGLDYEVTSKILVYGKVTHGYKSGGFNYAAPRPEGLTSKPEFVDSYEIGAKTDFRIGTMPVRLNVNAYRVDYKDIQRAAGDNYPNGTFDPTGVCLGPDGQPNGSSTCLDQGAIVFNADGARIQGIEVEAEIRPVEGLNLSGSYSYTDAKYTNFIQVVQPDPLDRTIDSCNGIQQVPFPGQAPIEIDLTCIPFAYTPKHILNLNARYILPLSEQVGTVALSGGYSYVSRTYESATTTPNEDPRAWRAGYGLFNASIEWNGILNSSIDARFFVTNLTNKVYRVGASPQLRTVSGFAYSIYGEPRMYGLSLRYRFGD